MRSRPAILLALLVTASCTDRSSDGPSSPTEPSMSRQSAGVPTRQSERPGTWIDLDDDALWQRISASGGVAAVGLKAPGSVRGVYRGELLIGRTDLQNARAGLLNRPGVTLVSADYLLPILEVRLADVRALRAIRRLPFIDYIEPVAAPQDLSTTASVGGCGYGSLWGADRRYTRNGDVYSEKFEAMGIPLAWSVSSGRGVTVASIDTGISPDQAQFFDQFATGESTGRSMALFQISSMSGPYDQCGHGTRMAGVIAAPNDGQNVVGVAWGANLVSVRHSNGVANVASSGARQSVRIASQNLSGAGVVSMAWQSMNWFWQVSDEIKYWHYRRQILFLAAAGTSGCWDLIPDNNVVFPAEMSEVVAVTGVSYPAETIPCGIHYGKQVELLAYLDVPTTGRNSDDIVSVGGSSNAVGIVAGIAALAWSREPQLKRDELRLRLQQSGRTYPVRDSRRGFGVVDAVRAVGGVSTTAAETGT